MINKFRGTCIRCGGAVLAEEGLLSFLTPEQKLLWPAYRFQRNVSFVEHHVCAARYTGTSTHWQFDPIKETT